MDFRLLGPLEVVSNDGAADVGSGKRAALLTYLLINANEVVSAERLIDELWGEHPPATAAKSVQVYVSQLRKALHANGDLLMTRGSGYVLKLDDAELDIKRFEQLFADAQRALADGDAERASRAARAALALWRGPALYDVLYESFAQNEAARLEQLRLVALETRIEADLALGRHAELIAELEALVAGHPANERFRAQLMLALYRCGRQADALEVYRQGSRVLMDELGLEPGPDLRELERKILDHSDELAAPRVKRSRLPGQPEAAPAPKAQRRVRRGAWAVAAGGALLVAAAVLAVIEIGGGDKTTVAVDRPAAALLDPATGALRASVGLGTAPSSVVAGEGAVWVLDADDKTISRIDPRKPALTRSFSIGSTPTDVAIGAGSVWVGSAFRAADYGNYPRSISRLDPVSGRTQETIALPRHGATGYFQGGGFSQQHIAATDSAVWAINPDATISRIDPRTNRRVATVRKVEVRSLAAGRRGVWGVTETGVVEIDPRRNVVARKVAIPAPSLLGIALGGGAVWVSDPFGGSVWRVDPEAKQQRQIPLDLGVRSIAFGNGALWVASEIGDKVYKIDPSTNKARVVNRLVAPQQVAIGEGGVWVTALGPPRGAETLPGGVCSPAITRAGSRPDVLIASDLPLQGSADTPTTLPMVAAIRFLLEQRGFKAGRHTVGYQSCDDSTAQAAGFDIFRCFANGKAYARDLHVVGVVGAYQSFCSSVEIPVANQAPGGPLAMVSPSNTLTFITRRDPSLPPNQLAALYPTGIRNYARIAPSYDLWAAAMPQAAQQLGKKRVYVLWDRRDADFTSFATIMRNSARKLGLDVVGAAGWDANAGSFAALARRVRAARPEALLLSGTFPRHSPAFFEALRAELGRGVLLIGNDGFGVPDMLHHLGPVTDGMYIVNYGRANAELPASGRRFLRLFGSATGRKAPDLSAAYSAAAAEVLLDAIARSDGTRASVTRQLLRTRIEDGIAGPVAFDRNGDLLHAPLTLSRWTGREMRPERVITVG